MKMHRPSRFIGLRHKASHGIRLAVVLTLGLAFVLAPATSASAGPVYTFEYDVAYHPVVDPAWPAKCVYAPPVGSGCYMATGDYFEVQDGYEDGYEVGVQWTTDYGRFGLCHNTRGTRSYGFCNKNFAEGKKVIFRFGRCDIETSRDGCRSRGWIWETGYRTVST